jgi:hypothetical protein
MTMSHDDAIASLMQELGRKQGYITSLDSNETRINQDCAEKTENAQNDDEGVRRTIRPSSAPSLNHGRFIKTEPPRLRPELDGYPKNNFLAGRHSIWNPLVAGDCSYRTTQSSDERASPRFNGVDIVLPTNPVVEVIRRRVYEKFRQEAQILLRDFQDQKWMIRSTKTAVSITKLPLPSMLEKWHMDAKLNERHHINKIVASKVGNTEHGSGTPNISGKKLNYMTSTVRIVQQRQRFVNQRIALYDPILLSKWAPTLFSDVLRPEVQKAWQMSLKKAGIANSTHLPPKYEKKANQLQKALYRLVCETIESFEKQLQSASYQESIQSDSSSITNRRRKQPKISIPTHSGRGGGGSIDESSSLVQITFSGVSFRLHKAYMEKLQRLYDRSSTSRSSDDENNDNDHQYYPSFAEALFCLLCRYDTIQGAGLQAGVPGAVMDVLLQRFGCRFECFASPFNCRYDRFGSAFEDIDVWFGSVGSFFDAFGVPEQQQQQAGRGIDNDDKSQEKVEDDDDDIDDHQMESCCYQANPPFCDGLILQLNDRIEKLLESPSPGASQMVVSSDPQRQRQQQQQRRHHRPVMFIVFVPAWRTAPCYQALLANPKLRYHLLLPQGQHWYTEGTQHRRKDSFRIASFDTSVLFYQNDSAQTKWNLTTTVHNDDGKTTTSSVPTMMDELRKAFCDDPGHLNKEQTTIQQNSNVCSGTVQIGTSTIVSKSFKTATTITHIKDGTVATSEEGIQVPTTSSSSKKMSVPDSLRIGKYPTKKRLSQQQQQHHPLVHTSQVSSECQLESTKNSTSTTRKRKTGSSGTREDPSSPTKVPSVTMTTTTTTTMKKKRRTKVLNVIEEGRSQLELLQSLGLVSSSSSSTPTSSSAKDRRRS